MTAYKRDLSSVQAVVVAAACDGRPDALDDGDDCTAFDDILLSFVPLLLGIPFDDDIEGEEEEGVLHHMGNSLSEDESFDVEEEEPVHDDDETGVHNKNLVVVVATEQDAEEHSSCPLLAVNASFGEEDNQQSLLDGVRVASLEDRGYASYW